MKLTKEKYLEIDKKINSLNIYYDKIDISYIIRNYFIAQLRNKYNQGNKEIKLNKKIYLRLIKNGFSTLKNFLKKSEIIVFSNAERRKKIGENYFDRVASIVSEVSNDVLYIENPIIVDHKFPSKDIILSDALLFLISYFYSFFCYKKNKLVIDSELFRYAEEHGVPFNPVPLIKRFYSQYKVMQLYLRFINKPKIVYEAYPIGYYGYNYAFKEQSIPIIELQHGVIYPLHPAYNCSNFISADMFKPNYIFTYGLKDKECLESMNYINKENIITVGSYGLEKNKNSKEIIGEYLTEFTKTNQKIISVIPTTEDLNELFEISKEIEKKLKNEYLILILPRFESTELKDTINVKILNTSKTNIFELYNISNFLITKNSTAALESLYMNIPTFIYETEYSIFRTNYAYLDTLNYFNTSQQITEKIINKEYILPDSNEINNIYQNNVIANAKIIHEKINETRC